MAISKSYLSFAAPSLAEEKKAGFFIMIRNKFGFFLWSRDVVIHVRTMSTSASSWRPRCSLRWVDESIRLQVLRSLEMISIRRWLTWIIIEDKCVQITNSKLEYFFAFKWKEDQSRSRSRFPSCGPSISQSGTNKLDEKKINPHETEQKITNDKRS